MVSSLVGVIGLSLSCCCAEYFPAEARAAVLKLGHPQFVEREKAGQFLIDFGMKAVPALREGEASPNPEIAERSRTARLVVLQSDLSARLLAPANYNANFDGLNFEQTKAHLEGMLKQQINVDMNLKPNAITLAMRGPMPFWAMIERIEDAFDVQYTISADQGVFFPRRDEFQAVTNLGSFRLLGSLLPQGEQEDEVPLILSLQPDTRRSVVRLDSVRVDTLRTENGDELKVKDCIVAPPTADPTRMRQFRGGRIIVGGNGAEIVPDTSRAYPTLTPQQIVLPIIWPEAHKKVQVVAGVLRAQVRGEPGVLCRIDNINPSGGSDDLGTMRLNVALPKRDVNGNLKMLATVTYLRDEASFPENPTLEIPDTETVIINGRARIYFRGQGSSNFNGARYGAGAFMSYHGVQMLNDEGKPVPFKLDSPILNFGSDGTIMEQFMLIVDAETQTKFGDPQSVTLTGTRTRSISIPFELKHFTRPPKVSP